MVRDAKVAVIFVNFVLISEEGKHRFTVTWKEKLECEFSLCTS